jgi:hypothetical protein
MIVPPIYDWVYSFSEGMAVVGIGETWFNAKFGFIDKTGREILPPTSNYIIIESFSDGLALFGIGEFVAGYGGVRASKYGFLDKTGKVVVPPTYDYAYSFSGGAARVGILKSGASGFSWSDFDWSFIDKTGKEVVPPEYEDDYGEENRYFPFVGFGEFFDGLSAFERNGKWGFIDENGNIVVTPKYDYVRNFSEGMAAVSNGGEFFGVDDVWWGGPPIYDGGKWGFIDKAGNEIVPIKYDEVGHFVEGITTVWLNDDMGIIDKTGREIVPLGRYGLQSFTKDGEYSGHSTDGMVAIEQNDKWGFIEIKSSSSTPPPTPPPVTVNPTASTVLVDGKAVQFDAYLIGSFNFFKLRDLAMAINGSSKQADIGFDRTTDAITITRGRAYTPAGGELVAGDGTAKQARPNPTINISMDGIKVDIEAYMIGSNNFMKLRDVMKLLDVSVDFDRATGNIILDTTKGYVDP